MPSATEVPRTDADGGRFHLLYDGQCPICRREVHWLMRRDRRDGLATEDIAAADFDPGKYGLTHQQVQEAIHGIKPDGTIVRGMDAVYEAYRAIGWGWVIAPTRLPVMRPAFDAAYRLFARNRQRLGQWLGRHDHASDHL